MTQLRARFDRLVPRGALILSVLSFGYFAMGVLRNRVFANTFGAGTELDAYYAAFRLPEIALDVLVAAGLTAPFVPDLHDPSPRRPVRRRTVRADRPDRGDRPHDRRQCHDLRPGAMDRRTRSPGFDGPTRALYVDLLRINCFAQVLFAASFALGEILVAHRRFVFVRARTDPVHERHRRRRRCSSPTGTASSPPPGAPSPGPGAHLAVRAVGTLRTASGSGFAGAVRTPAFREFVRLMLPRMAATRSSS